MITKNIWSMKWTIVMVVAGIGLAAYFGTPLVLGPSIVMDTANRGELVQTIVASGHVETPFRVNVSSQVTGVVAAVPVTEGQMVKAGEALVLLDDKEARSGVVQAEGSVAQAEARMRQMAELTLPSAQQTQQQAQATLLNAQQTYDRIVKLTRDGYSTRSSLDEAIKAVDIAKAQARNAELLVFTARPGGSDHVMAQTQLNQARAGLLTAQSRLGYTIIVAPRDGVLISRDVEQGKVVQPSNVLMQLSPSGETQIIVQIDEKNLGLIAVGQKALASADAYARQSFAADIIYINPGIDLQRASVEVKLRVPAPPDYLRQDMTVSVDVEIARRPNAVIVLSGSVHDIASGKAWVMKADAGRARRQAVDIGIVAGGKAEVLSGIEAGDLLIPASTASVKAGQRVRTGLPAGSSP